MALTSASVGLGFDLGRCRFPERGRLGAAAPLAVRADSGRLRLPAAEAGPAVARVEAGRLRLRPLAGIGESYGHPRRELALATVTRGWLGARRRSVNGQPQRDQHPGLRNRRGNVQILD